MPQLWIVAGPNGSGKSTLVDRFLSAQPMLRSFAFLNADEVTRRIAVAEPDLPLAEANLRAARQVDAVLAERISLGADVVVETVLSSSKYQDDVEVALRKGYRVTLVFVCLVQPELSQRRVAQRVAAGGHHVEPQKVAERWGRSIANLPWFAERAHDVFVFDNSDPRAGSGPTLIAEKAGGGALRLLVPGRIPAIDAALKGAGLVREPR